VKGHVIYIIFPNCWTKKAAANSNEKEMGLKISVFPIIG
jgi:hypothetical protein